MDARAWRPCCHGFLAKRRRGDGGSFAIAGMWESFIMVADTAWPKTPRCLPLFSHPLKPLNVWLSFSGYLNWLRKWTLTKPSSYCFGHFLQNDQNMKNIKSTTCFAQEKDSHQGSVKWSVGLSISVGKARHATVFTGDIKYFYSCKQIAEHKQSTIFRFLFVVNTTHICLCIYIYVCE